MTDSKETVTRFFRTLYPEGLQDGIFLAHFATGKPWRNEFFTDLESLAEKASLLPSENVYFTPCLFSPTPGGDCERKDRYAAAILGPWFDFDCLGEQEDETSARKPHAQTALPTKQEILDFIKKELPEPTILVDTGHGFHAYWLFESLFRIKCPEDRERAKRLSKGFQSEIIRLAAKRGWKFDNTSDLSRVLRLPGSVNHKTGSPVPVTLVHMNEHCRYDFEALFTRYGAPASGDAAARSPKMALANTQSGYPEAGAGKILERCAFLRHCRDDAETLTEPEWFAMFSIIARCEGGRELCHEFSKPYPRYSWEETEGKVDQAIEAASPRTCANIEETFGDTYCRECPERGKAKSPISLGTPHALAKRESSPEGHMETTLPPQLGTIRYEIPAGYAMSDEGIFSVPEKGKGERIATCPIFLSGRRENCSTQDEKVSLVWPRNGKWKVTLVLRGDIADPRKLILQANKGFPVDCNNVRALVDFLVGSEHCNLSRLTCRKDTDTLGWHEEEEGRWGFVLGDTYIDPAGKPLRDDDLGRVAFTPSSGGMAQLEKAFSEKGSMEEWLKAFELILPFPVALLALLTALAAPLLRIFDLPGFCLDLAYTTSSGKTTCQRIAASVFGCPLEYKPASAVLSWSGTRVSHERTAGALQGIPLVLNDSKQVTKSEHAVQFVYDITNGQGKGRGAPEGLQSRSIIQTNLISSGEDPIVDSSESGGVRVRAITVTLPPFGDMNRADLVKQVNAALTDHYGHSGPLFISYVLSHLQDRPAWQAFLKERADTYLEKANKNPFVSRLAEPFALIDLAAQLAEKAWGLAEPIPSPICGLWDSLTSETATADRSEQALEYLISRCCEHMSYFWQKGGQTPITACWGRWDRQGADFGNLCIYKAKAKELLEAGGYEPSSVIRRWKEKDFLSTDKERNDKNIQTQGGSLARMFVIKKSALESHGFSSEQPQAGVPRGAGSNQQSGNQRGGAPFEPAAMPLPKAAEPFPDPFLGELCILPRFDEEEPYDWTQVPLCEENLTPLSEERKRIIDDGFL